MKRPLYYLFCAIACMSMVDTTMPMAAIAEAIQPQETAEQQVQADATASDATKSGGGASTNAPAANAATNSATTPTNTTQTNPADANTAGAATTPNGTTGTTATATPGDTAATGSSTTPTPSLRAQTTPTPEAITTAAATAYAHSATATQNGVTFTVSWNDAPAGTATTFHVTQANGSSQAKARMDVPTYWDGGSQESVCDPSRQAWASYHSLGTAGHDFTFDFTASGTYRIYFYFMDNDRNDPQNDKGIYYLRTTTEVTVNDAARPSVTQIVNSAVAQCRQETNGSEYDMALWLHDWTLDQLEYDHSLNWCSAESGLTRHQGTCESYQRIYSKLLNAAGIANGRITGNGHTWNAVKIDGKWCQMDLTWDDTNDNWYGDLDQRHLYFGLTDELMAIAHSDHTANYQKDDYAHRSTDLSNNFFVRNGKADEWAEKYADRIQQHLDAKEESFSIDADNQSFPPSISGIQNGIVAYAMNLREWKANDAKVELTAASNVTKESNSKWSAKYDLRTSYETTYTITAMPKDCEVSNGAQAEFTVTAPSATSFQWQCSDNGGSSWYNTGIGGETSEQETLRFASNAQLAKRLYRCVVSFPNSSTLVSKPARLVLAARYAISSQPEDCTATAGSTAFFAIEAERATSFQWQCSDNEGKSWYNTGVGGSTSTQTRIEFIASAGLAKRHFRCLAFFPDGTSSASSSAYLKLSTNQITGQPQDTTAATGSEVSFTVQAQGAVSFQWQCSDNDGGSWYNTGIGNAASRQSTLRFTANATLAKRLYRCVVTFQDGTTTATQNAKLALVPNKGRIIAQPRDFVTSAGTEAAFSVDAEHAAAYQWQCSDNGGRTWYNTAIGGVTSKSNTMSFTATEGLAKRLFRCLVSLEDGSKQASEAAKLLLQ